MSPSHRQGCRRHHGLRYDSKQTLLCTYLLAVLLLGLLANAIMGWSWADPIAGLIIAAVAVREGVEAWRGESCDCAPVGLAQADRTREDATDKEDPEAMRSGSTAAVTTSAASEQTRCRRPHRTGMPHVRKVLANIAA